MQDMQDTQDVKDKIAELLSTKLWVQDALIPENEATELIKPVFDDHWELIDAIHHGYSKPDLAYIKLDPLVVGVSVLGEMKPKSDSLEDVAACFIEAYYPNIIIQ